MVQPCTRLTCRSNSFRSCTLRLCVLVLCWERGVNSVPFMHTCAAKRMLFSVAHMQEHMHNTSQASKSIYNYAREKLRRPLCGLCMTLQ